MRFDILSVFPDMIKPALTESIIGRAEKGGLVEVHFHNIRDYTTDKHRRTDDTPYGGGWGMVMTPQPIIDCHSAVVGDDEDAYTVYMSPGGKPLNQKKVISLSKKKRIVILCGHYEGVDQRVIESIVDEEISIGDYVLTGGELPAAVLVDAVARQIPDVLPDKECHEDESIESGLLEYPQYTKPYDFRGMKVPDILLSGHHSKITAWRKQKSLEKTFNVRRDLLRRYKATDDERLYIERLKQEKKSKK